MSKVFFSVGMSLDGYIAPEGMTLEHAYDPSYKNWMQQWEDMQAWIGQQQFFRDNLQLGGGGETGRDNQLLVDTFERTSVNIMGKTMFSGGELFWPEEAPFHTPVFVLTHEKREPWVRPGGTTFYFVNDGIESALEQARAAAGDRDIRIAGGGNLIVQLLNAGVVDEFTVSLAPVFFGGGTSLFGSINPDAVKFEIVEVINSPLVTHLRYVVKK